MPKRIHLIKPFLFRGDRFYKLYSTDECLTFIKLGGQFYTETTRDPYLPLPLEIVYSLFFERKWRKKRLMKERAIDHQVKMNLESLLKESDHFQLPFCDIKYIEISHKSSLHTGFSDNGEATIFSTSGKKMKLFIASSSSVEALVAILENYNLPFKVVDYKGALF